MTARDSRWILSSWTGVVSALRDARLSAAGGEDPAAHESLRESAARVLAPERMDDWRTAMLRSAGDMVRGLPADEPVDLIAAYARPWSRELAMRVAGAPSAGAGRLAELASEIFLAAAHATDARPAPAALTATTALVRALPDADPAIAVQAFVALSETLPCLLAGVWLELFSRPPLAQQLRAQLPALSGAPGIRTADALPPRDDSKDTVPRVLEELMRLAGPDRAVFRQATGGTTIGDARIAAGDGVILMLAAANRDPIAFPDPDAVDVSRSAPAHLTFGRGPHRCAGASLVRMAVTIATAALVESTSGIELIGEVEWIGGFAIRGPAALPAVLRRQPPDGPSDPPGAHSTVERVATARRRCPAVHPPSP